MLPTFVIGLREGLEAALIVGIIAAFLAKQGRVDLLRWVFVGVATAVALCLGVGVALEVVSRNLPQRQQEGLETVVGVLAVAMVTYMVVWMRRHSRELKGTLEGAAASALADGSGQAGRALVVMAFLAVLREGFETVVFLLAAFNETGNSASAVAGALLGIAVAIGLGWGIYRGGVRLNLAKFFRATGLVLVLVAAGLVVTALHTAHEAGWLNAGQGSTIDLTWLVRPGSVQASLLTGMLGVQDHPVVIEVVGWLLYLVPVGLYVAWPAGRRVAPARVAAAAGLVGAAAALAAVVVAIAVPSVPGTRPVTTAGTQSVQVLSHQGSTAVIRSGSPATDLTFHRTGTKVSAALLLDRYVATVAQSAVGQQASLGEQQIARINGGRLPLGVTAGARRRMPVSYVDTTKATAWVEPHTLRVLEVSWTRQRTVMLHTALGPIPLDRPILTTTSALPATATADAIDAARGDVALLDRHRHRHDLAVCLAVVSAALLLAAAVMAAVALRRSTLAVDAPDTGLIGHEVSLT